MKLKSGITKEWLRKSIDAEGKLTDREIWVDEFGKWHEMQKDGTEVIYAREKAEVIMHDARGVSGIPEEHRICAFWLKLDGQWVAPMVCLGYKNNPATSQVVYSEKIEREEGGHHIYTETLILDKEKGARVHVVNTALDEGMHRLPHESWSKWVDLE